MFASFVGAVAIYAGVASAVPMDYGPSSGYESHSHPTHSILAYLRSILAMGVLPLLRALTVTATVVAAATATATTTTTTVQAVLLRCQCQRLWRLIQQAHHLTALHHTALLPMARAPQTGATAVTIITVCNVSSLSSCLLDLPDIA